MVGTDSVLVALAVCGLLLLLAMRKLPGALYVFLLGLALLHLARPEAYGQLSVGLPVITSHWPAAGEWAGGLVKAALPQAPLTVLNSVVAVCALSATYFPERGIAPRRMAASVGAMNLLCVPLGGIPMCHGSGGLAAQYTFGARTGGSVVMLGAGKALAGLVLGGSLSLMVDAYPVAVLAPLLVLAGLELARAARSTAAPKNWTVPLLTAACVLGATPALGPSPGVSPRPPRACGAGGRTPEIIMQSDDAGRIQVTIR